MPENKPTWESLRRTAEDAVLIRKTREVRWLQGTKKAHEYAEMAEEAVEAHLWERAATLAGMAQAFALIALAEKE